MRYRIAIVNSKTFGVYTDAVDRLRRIGHVVRMEVPKDIDGKLLAEKLRGFHFVVASVTPKYNREFFNFNDDVVLIARHGIGYDNIDVKAATEAGVVVTRVPGYYEREAVAEHTIGLLLAAIRRIPQAYFAVKKGRWKDRGKFISFELKNSTIGVIGCGNIGSRVVELLRALGAHILVYDPYVPKERVRSLGAEPVDFDTLLRKSDAITIHAVLTEETYHMLNQEAFKKMKRGVVIVNTARGEIIDTRALVQAIEEGIVGAVALDVVEGEPIDEKHELLKYDNVIITPHIAAFTYQALRGMDDAVVKAILDIIEGRHPEGTVNEEVFKRGVRKLP
ncbi:MAG: hydroxyacid dehydrogenase [Thermoprotei archaeon]|nr:MAG: hydroxyacid dehydrogenase [Thermoprotei archaeon]RLF23642.1 MAG: hydroxyacid dehydrogenase [Thermoprotei archaeon]